MEHEFGKIQIKEEKTVIWNLEGEQPKKDLKSPYFYVPGFSNAFLFYVMIKKEDLATLILYKTFDGVFKIYDFQVILSYNSKEKKQFTVKKSLFCESKTWFLYNIGEISIAGLLEITCKILKVYIPTEIQVDKGVQTEMDEMKYNKVKEEIVCDLKEEEDKVEREGNECERETDEIGCNKQINKASSEYEDGDAKVERERNYKIKTNGEIALITSLRNIFLGEEYSDVKIKVGDQNYPAHKLLISSRSPVFDKILKQDVVEKKQGVIYVPDCDTYIFRDFLLYIYTGKIDNINNENVFDLYHMSDKYEVKELKKECADFLKRNLTTDIICKVIFLASKHQDSSLLMHATKYFLDNAKEIVLSVEWKEFVKENPEEANEIFVKFVNKSSLQ